jgi:hypothetical protein
VGPSTIFSDEPQHAEYGNRFISFTDRNETVVAKEAGAKPR